MKVSLKEKIIKIFFDQVWSSEEILNLKKIITSNTKFIKTEKNVTPINIIIEAEIITNLIKSA